MDAINVSVQTLQNKGIVIGCRVPRSYFLTKGIGESDITIHAGSYHLALKAAGIESYNIMTYSSIMPAIATEISRPAQPLTHGMVMETIMAASNATQGQRATAGIIYGWLYHKHSGQKFGGLVCEYNGDLAEAAARAQLRESLDELYYNGFSDDYDLRDITLTSQSIVPTKKYGTAIVAICFTDYLVPIVESEQEHANGSRNGNGIHSTNGFHTNGFSARKNGHCC